MLSENVYNGLLDMLMKGEIVPGEILNRRDIAAKFGVSVAPVLEAMLRLELEGYLETHPCKGTQVKIIRPEDVRGQLLLKAGIECIAVRMFCGEKVRQNYDRLLELATAIEKEFEENGDSQTTWRMDMEFHNELISLCGNEAICEQYAKLAVPCLFYNLHKYIQHTGDDRNDHITLLNALCTDDKDAAEKALRAHLLNGKGDIKEYA